MSWYFSFTSDVTIYQVGYAYIYHRGVRVRDAKIAALKILFISKTRLFLQNIHRKEVNNIYLSVSIHILSQIQHIFYKNICVCFLY